MTASCDLRRAPPRRPESPCSSRCLVGIILVALVLRLPASFGACVKPPVYQSMKVRGSPKPSYLPGQRIYFDCKPGYYYSVYLPRNTICEKNGSWRRIDEACFKKGCSVPLISNGEVLAPQGGYEFGKEVHFLCDYGYYLIGEKILNCKFDGKNVFWDRDIPKCEKVKCKSPGKIKNGKPTNSRKDIFEYNDVITYTCDPPNEAESYVLIGESTLTCSGFGNWSSNPPKCEVVQCDVPTLDHGRLVSNIKDKYSYQDMVTLECQEGFSLNGRNSVFCGETSTWEPEMPVCIQVVQCDVPTLDHGRLVSNIKEKYLYQEVVTLECQEGFSLIGRNSVFCGETSTWEPEMPVCIQVVECDVPTLDHGRLVSNIKEKYSYQEVVTLECQEGFSLNGRNSVFCGRTNTWEPEMPVCIQVVECDVPTLDHGRLVSNIKDKYSYQEMVTLECQEGFSLNGRNSVFCGETNTWEPEMPVCIQDFKPTHPTTPPVSKFPDQEISTAVILILLFAILATCTYLYICLRRRKKSRSEQHPNEPALPVQSPSGVKLPAEALGETPARVPSGSLGGTSGKVPSGSLGVTPARVPSGSLGGTAGKVPSGSLGVTPARVPSGSLGGTAGKAPSEALREEPGKESATVRK